MVGQARLFALLLISIAVTATKSENAAAPGCTDNAEQITPFLKYYKAEENLPVAQGILTERISTGRQMLYWILIIVNGTLLGSKSKKLDICHKN